jgi:hypothetical protein
MAARSKSDKKVRQGREARGALGGVRTGRRENGDYKAGSGAWKRKKGAGLVRRDVAVSIVGVRHRQRRGHEGAGRRSACRGRGSEQSG